MVKYRESVVRKMKRAQDECAEMEEVVSHTSDLVAEAREQVAVQEQQMHKIEENCRREKEVVINSNVFYDSSS